MYFKYITDDKWDLNECILSRQYTIVHESSVNASLHEKYAKLTKKTYHVNVDPL